MIGLIIYLLWLIGCFTAVSLFTMEMLYQYKAFTIERLAKIYFLSLFSWITVMYFNYRDRRNIWLRR